MNPISVKFIESMVEDGNPELEEEWTLVSQWRPNI